ncbi:MAG: TAXI family TRAP transporter solute-binding subunit [Bradymonadia bacterium]
MHLLRTLTSLVSLGVAFIPSLALSQTAEKGEPSVEVGTQPSVEAAEATEGKRPKVRICTAQPGNNYHRYGVALAARLKAEVDVTLVETKGSWENLEMMDSNPRRCDAIIAQDDAHALHQFEKPDSGLTVDRTATIYPEFAHLLCHRKVSGNNLSELDPSKHPIIVNQYGSGSYITWRLFRRMNPHYKQFEMIEKNLDEGILRLLNGEKPACLFFVSGLGGETLATADQTFGDQIKLLGIADPKLTRRVGRDKRQIYRLSSIASDTYKNLNHTQVTVPTVGAVFFTSPEWKARYPKAARSLASALLKVISEGRQ